MVPGFLRNLLGLEKAKRKRKNDESEVYLGYDIADSPFTGSLLPEDEATRSFSCGIDFSAAAFTLMMLMCAVIAAFAIASDGGTTSQTEPTATIRRVVVLPVESGTDVPLLYNQLSWLQPEDAAKLREHTNVVNLAWLHSNGDVEYAESVSLMLDATWQQYMPPRYELISVFGTATKLQFRDRNYNLNVLQPFVHEESPAEVCVIDTFGVFWCKAFESDVISPLSIVEDQLPVRIEPNGSLSLTYFE